MAVYKRSYRAYEGSTTPERWRFLVLSRYAFFGLFDSRPFTAFFVLCFVPFLLAFAIIYISHSPSVRVLLQYQGPNPVDINNYFFAFFLGIQSWLGFLLITWCGPQLVAADLANSALPLILSRPISRTEYVVGKMTVIATLLSAIMLLPTLILFFLHAGLQGDGWIWSNLWMVASIVIASIMWIAVVGLIALASSAWLKWRVAASALMLAIFFVGPGLAAAINLTLDTNWGHIFDLGYAVKVIWFGMFRVPLETMHRLRIAELSLPAAWMVVIGFCAASLLLLNRRLKAREVVRG
jgi:ABC-2 type transport system permease protein